MVFFTILMQVLHWLKVNVFKVVILMGTFALALAFAGNDLVNFIGVPLAGYSSYMDLMAQGGTTTTDTIFDDLLVGTGPDTLVFLGGVRDRDGNRLGYLQKGSERGEDFLGSVSSIGWRGVFRYIACRAGIGTELQ